MKTETVRLREFVPVFDLVSKPPRGLEAMLYNMGFGPYPTRAMLEENKFLARFNYGRNPAQTGLKEETFARLYGRTPPRHGKTNTLLAMAEYAARHGHWPGEAHIEYAALEHRAMAYYEDVVQNGIVVHRNSGSPTGRLPRPPNYFMGSLTPQRLIEGKNSLLQRAAAERLTNKHLRAMHDMARDKD